MGGLEGATSGSRFASWFSTDLVAASALNLAAAIALSGFSALAAGSAYLVRLGWARSVFHSSYFAKKQSL